MRKKRKNKYNHFSDGSSYVTKLNALNFENDSYQLGFWYIF